MKVLACMTGCFGQDDEAACQFICQWELGQANEKYLNLLKCMAEHGCLSMQPDGICLGDSRCDFVLQFHGNLPPPFLIEADLKKIPCHISIATN